MTTEHAFEQLIKPYAEIKEGLKATEDCYFRPGGGDAWEESVIFTKDEILNPAKNTFKTRFFRIEIDEKSADLLKGEIIFEEGGLKINAGKFTLGANQGYSTEHLNVAYDTHLRLTIKWFVKAEKEADDVDNTYELTVGNSIAKAIEFAVRQYGAMVLPPATGHYISMCNADLRECELPELPADYADFLKTHCGGYAFDSVVLYGLDNITGCGINFTVVNIITATEEFNKYYVDGGYIDIDHPLLCFGQQNGDYFTYDPNTGKYQLRDHEDACNTVWEEYDTFEEFFAAEVAAYSGLSLNNKNNYEHNN